MTMMMTDDVDNCNNADNKNSAMQTTVPKYYQLLLSETLTHRLNKNKRNSGKIDCKILMHVFGADSN